MDIARLDPLTIALTGLDSFIAAVLREIVPSASPGDHPAARARLYSSPTAGAEPEFDADWEAYVAPDLREQFESSVSLVERDLATLAVDSATGLAALRIPVAHLDSWISALNQARLALAARYDVAGGEMESEILLGDKRGYALFQIEFYGDLQFYFLRELPPNA